MLRYCTVTACGSLLIGLLLPCCCTPALAQRREQFRPRRLAVTSEADLHTLRQFGKREARVHDPSSIVRCEDEYWLFATGQGVQSWRSADLVRWRRGPRVFDQPPAWVTEVVPSQRGHFWAPDVVFHQDRYWLFYSVSSFGVNTSAIALASTPTLNPEDAAFQWQDHGVIVRSRREDDFNAIDPAILKTSEGRLWMSFGSFWSGIKLVELDSGTLKRKNEDAPMHAIAFAKEIEAPHIAVHEGYYYLFVNWGLCCRGVRSTYNIRVGRSRDVTGPYLDKEGKSLMRGGGTLLLSGDAPFIGPGHANVFRAEGKCSFSCHFYDGTQRGRSYLAILPLNWAPDGWPAVERER